MINRNLLINSFDETARQLARKKVDRQFLLDTRDLLLKRNEVQSMVDTERTELNRRSKEVGKLKQQGLHSDAEEYIESVAQLKSTISDLEAQARELDEKVEYNMLRIPNIPSDDAPNGESEADNVVRRIHGYDDANFKNRTFKPHWEVAEALAIYDAERATKISGSMFALLRNDGARLLRALVSFALDLNRDKYEEILPPHFVTSSTFKTTGHLPKFENDAYQLAKDDLWAIPTGEVPLMSLHRDEILDEEELPKKYMAYTVCFRREAGSAGKDTRGMQRLHEFHKVELVKLCTPDQVQSEFNGLLGDAEKAIQLLGLPYRVVDLCAADLTFSSARIFDLEVYSPGVDRWLEVSSVGIFSDFQPRRGMIRYRRKDTKKVDFVHALNGSALATPRVWAAIIEHGQQEDGSVKIPDVLIPYMGKEVIK